MSAQGHHFEILEIPGGGSYATVCVARERNGRRVALKVLKASFTRDLDLLKRTRDEARMLHRLRHENVLEVEALLAIDGRPVVVMEYVEGLPLDQVVRELRAGLPTAVALEVVRQVARALDAAYNAPVGDARQPLRVVHRDVKPSNVLLSVGGAVKLTDFGVAKGEFDDREAQSLYLVHGSRGYMAPERYVGGRDTPAVDVYALGLTAFELLTGKPAVISVAEDRHDETLQRVLPFLAPAGVTPEAAEVLRGLVRDMCAYHAAQRPEPRVVMARIEGWLAETGLTPDLAAFAREVVQPIRLKRRKIDPRNHPLWREVAFLHGDGATENLSDVPTDELGDRLPVSEVDALVRRRLRLPGWTEHAAELRAATRGRTDWSVKPLLGVLADGTVPSWQFWKKRAAVDQLRLALDLLRERREPSVLAAAARLLRHQDAEVARAARGIVDDVG